MFEREREDFKDGVRRSHGRRGGPVSLPSVMPHLGSGYSRRCVDGAGRGAFDLGEEGVLGRELW